MCRIVILLWLAILTAGTAMPVNATVDDVALAIALRRIRERKEQKRTRPDDDSFWLYGDFDEFAYYASRQRLEHDGVCDLPVDGDFIGHKALWLPYQHLVYATELVWPAIKKGNARIIINMPPGSGKSLTFSKFLPLKYLVENPARQIGLISYEGGVARRWGRRVRDAIEENKRIPLTVRRDKRAESNWELPQGGGMITTGSKGAIVGERIGLLIFDDPTKNLEQARSATIQKTLQDDFEASFMRRLDPGGSAVIIMQRWTDNDICGYLEKQGGWKVIKLPAIAEEGDVLGRKIGEPLVPERFTLDDLMEIKRTLPPIRWAGLYQQRPEPEGGGVVNRDWWQFFKVFPEQFDEIFQSWDMTFKKTTTGSFVCGKVYGRKGGSLYMLDQIRDRLSFTETVQAVRNMTARWPAAHRKLVENKANGPAIVSQLQREIGGFVEVDPKELGGDKYSRAEAAAVYIRSGNIYLPDPSLRSWAADTVEEWAVFPDGSNDDIVDCDSQAILTTFTGHSYLDNLRKALGK